MSTIEEAIYAAAFVRFYAQEMDRKAAFDILKGGSFDMEKVKRDSQKAARTADARAKGVVRAYKDLQEDQ